MQKDENVQRLATNGRMDETLNGKRGRAIADLGVALEEIEGGDGLSMFVEGHGIQSLVFRFDWREPALQISYELPVGRVLSGEETETRDNAEIAAAIRMALVLLRVVAEGKIAEAGCASISVSCDDSGARYAVRADDGALIDGAEGWTGLVARLEGLFGADAADELVVFWP